FPPRRWRRARAQAPTMPIGSGARAARRTSPDAAAAGAAIPGEPVVGGAISGEVIPAAAIALQPVVRRSMRSLHLRPCRSSPHAAVDRQLPTAPPKPGAGHDPQGREGISLLEVRA